MMIHILAAAQTGGFAEDTRIYERSVDSTNLLLDYWWVGGLAVAAVAVFVSLSGKRRNVGELEARCTAAFGDVDAILAERHALIPNLVEVTKAHAGQEIQVLDRLIEAQQAALETMGYNRMTAETEVGNALNQLINVASSMPKLTSNSEFPRLREELTRIEEKVTAARRYYNTTVAEYDAARSAFVPGLIAKVSKMPRHVSFDLGDKREEVSQPQTVAFG